MELYTLVQSGITFNDGILMMQDDETEAEGKALLQKLIDSLEKGSPLSAALTESGHFPRYMVNMLIVGEETGRVGETLKALSEYYDKQDRQKTAIKNAVLYPAILLVLMVAVVLILIVKVLPIFNDVFNQLGSQMSPLAVQLMQFGKWLESTSLFIAAVMFVIIVVAIISWAVPGIREGILGVFKNISGDRGISGDIAVSRFTSAMYLALASGLETEKAVEMSANVSGGVKSVDVKYSKCMELIRSGQTLSESMRSAGILSARDSRMLSLGERSGATDTVIAEIARKADLKVQDAIEGIVTKIEPTLVILTSVIVGVILFSVMLPLMGIMTSIG